MPRGAKKESSSGVFHVIVLSINKQRIFEDEEDYSILLEKIRKHKKTSGYEIFTGCRLPDEQLAR